jgi:hypothetical protein
MMNSHEARLKSYLLDQLGADDRAEIEREYFEDDDKFGALLAVEDELVNQYVRREMPEQERLLFERTFLATPAGRERVRVAGILRGAVARLDDDGRGMPPGRRAFSWRARLASGGIGYRWAAAVALLILVSAGLWSLFEIGRLRDRIHDLDTARETLQRDAEAAREETVAEQARANSYQEELQRLRSVAPAQSKTSRPSSTVTLSLVPVALRSAGEPDQVVVGVDTRVVELDLAVDSSQKLESFRVALEDAGRPVGSIEVLKVQAQVPGVITVAIPASMLTPGVSYTARLERPGGQRAPEIHRYEFRVVAR